MPRPGLQVVTRYTSCTHIDRSPLLYVHVGLPVQTNQSGLVTLTFDLLTLKVVSESCVTWSTSVPILVFLGLSVLELGLTYATDRETNVRQTDVRRQTKSWLNAPPIRGGGIIIDNSTVTYGRNFRGCYYIISTCSSSSSLSQSSPIR